MHILSPENDDCPSWISGRERMTVENISWSISTKECCRPLWRLNPPPPGLQSDGASNWATEASYCHIYKNTIQKILHEWSFNMKFMKQVSNFGIFASLGEQKAKITRVSKFHIKWPQIYKILFTWPFQWQKRTKYIDNGFPYLSGPTPYPGFNSTV